MGEITTVGLDLAKHVFQVHGVDAGGATVVRKQLRRAQVLAFFSRLPRCLVGLEACATAHYWARELRALGHEVRLMPAQYVKAYVKRNKNDAADAEAICEAVVRPTMRFVPAKTATEAAAAVLGVKLQTFAARGPDELDDAFAAITRAGVDSLLVLTDPILNLHQKQIIDFAERSRLPAMYGLREFAADGGLMAYAPDRTGQYRCAAAYVDKILKGAKPADLPVEQPTKFEFVLNLKTAKTLGLTFPRPLLGRADEVIE